MFRALSSRICPAANTRGFTIMEAIIAIGLASVVIIGAGEGLVMISGGASKMMIRTTTDANSKSFNQTFTSIIESAYMASQFQHLPVSISCPPDSGAVTMQYPCVRQFDMTSGTFMASTPPTGLSQSLIEFYRDDDPGHAGNAMGKGATGLYDLEPVWGSASGAKIQATTPIALTTEQRGSSFFVTWPLSDETSVPFVMLRSTGSLFYMKFDGAAGALNVASSNPYSFFKSTAKLSADQLVNLKGSLMLIYNSLSPRQYAIQLVNDVIDCSPPNPGDSSPCEGYIYWAQPPAIPGIVANWGLAAAAGTDVEYALDLRPLTNLGGTRTFSSFYQPSPSTFGVNFNYNWGTPTQQQESSVYSFPSRVFSLSDDTNPMDFPTNSDAVFDVRRLQHYYDTVSTSIGNASAVTVGIQVLLTAYYLKVNAAATAQASKTGGKVYTLTTSNYNHANDAAPLPNSTSGDAEFSLLDQVNDKIVFARALGTNSLSLVVYHSNGKVSLLDPVLNRLIPLETPGMRSIGLWPSSLAVEPQMLFVGAPGS